MKERAHKAMDERTLYVGMDIRENKIQLCVYPPNNGEIIMILEDYPLAVAMDEEKKEWFYGEEAMEKGRRKEGIVVSGFLKHLEETEKLRIYGVDFLPEELFSKAIKKALLFLRIEFPNDLIKRLTVSLEEPSKKLTERLAWAFSKLGIGKDRLRIESHGQSFLCYVMGRKRKLWMGEAGLLDGSDGQLFFRRITLDRRKRPAIAGVTKETLRPGKEDAILAAVKPDIGVLYLTGSGFSGSEKEGLIQSLCRGRRGFLGENLYCQGACISAKQQDFPDLMEPLLFLEEDSIKCDISIPVYHNAKNCQAVLAGASETWYEVGREACLILDEEEEIPVTVSYVLSGVEKVFILALEGLWKRQPRMTKVLIKIVFTDKDTCIVTIKDLGFGEFCPSSKRIWEKTITI